MQPAVAHIRLDLQVHHRLLLAVIYTGNTGQVTLTLICLDSVNNIYRQVLGCHLLVIAEILLTIHQDT